MNILTLNGVDVSKLVTITWNEETIQSDDSGTDLAGNINIDIIAQKVMVSCSCGLLKWAEISTILKAIDSKVVGGANIEVVYPDAKQGLVTIKNFYVSDRSAPSTVYIDNDLYWEGLSFTLKEL